MRQVKAAPGRGQERDRNPPLVRSGGAGKGAFRFSSFGQIRFSFHCTLTVMAEFLHRGFGVFQVRKGHLMARGV